METRTIFSDPSGDAQKVRNASVRIFGVIAAVFFVLYVISQSFIVVQAGERAVIFSKISGVQSFQLSEGFHFNLPLVWQPTKYDVKTLTYTMSGGGTEASGERGRPMHEDGQVPDDALTALTSDGLPLTLDLSVRFHIDPDNVWKMHREVGPEFVDKIVRPASRSVARMAFAEYPVTDVYSGKRQQIIAQIQRELSEKFKVNYLILDEVLLRDIRFPAEFQNSIEQKQVAQQQTQQMVFEVDRARSEKQQKIVQAQGESEAIRKIADALTKNPQLIQYEYIHKLSPDVKVIITDSKTIISLGDILNAPDSGDKKGR